MSDALTAIAATVRKNGPKCGQVRLVLIDGPAGSGKSTFAQHLAHALGDCPVVSMDNLYNGWDAPLNGELYERISLQLLEAWREESSARYHRFNWHQMKFDNWIDLPFCDTVIIEGVGAMHPALSESACLTIWLEADEKFLLKRVLGRDGEDIREQMVLWQKMEREYFKKYKVQAAADFAMKTS